jgi:HEAT repeat protein
MPLIRKTPGPTPTSGAADYDGAVAGLRSAEADVRWRSARTLGAFPQAITPLGAAAATEADTRVREAIFTSLARIGSPDSAAALLPHVRSDDAARRTAAMDALKAMPQALSSAIARLLKDGDTDVRVLACDLARELPSAEATALLAIALDTDPEVNVCAAAVDVIADVGSADALEPLHRCALRFPGQPFLDFAIKIACDRIGAQAPSRG